MNPVEEEKQTQQQLVHRLFDEVWNKKKIEVFDEIFAPDLTLHWREKVTIGNKGLKEVIAHWLTAFPDIHHEIEEMLHTEDKVVVRWHGGGTHLGIFNGMLPTKREMKYSGITIFRVGKGKLSEIWLSSDLLNVMEKLKVFSDKIYKRADFSVDFEGPAGKIYEWIFNARPLPSCKQKMADALREIFSTGPIDNKPELIIPSELFEKVFVRERVLPGGIRSLIYSPDNPESRALPILVYYHGGGWSIAHPDDSDLVTRKLAYLGDCIVISIDYRLAPENPFPCGLDDCVSAYKWARENGQKELSSNGDKIAVGGDSCGGNLSPAVVLRCGDEGYRIPDACLAICPLTDFIFEKYPSALKYGPDALVYDFAFLSFVRSIYAPYDMWQHPYVSPMYGDLSNFCPTFVLSAGRDLLIDENNVFVKKLRDAGSPVEQVTHEEMPHAYYYFLGLTKEEDEAFQKISSFLRRVLS